MRNKKKIEESIYILFITMLLTTVGITITILMDFIQ